MIIRACDHSYNPKLLSGGYVLDAGARGFGFSMAMVNKGCKVIALDPGSDVELPSDNRIVFYREALVAKSIGPEIFDDKVGDNQYGSHLRRIKGGPGETVSVATVDLAQLSARHNIQTWDLIKLDVEGAEYEILKSIDHAIATQLTVEFHNWDEWDLNGLVKHLNQWYRTVVFGKTLLGGQMGYWDALFIAKT